VVATDVNNDGKTDLFVANDTMANFLFMNRGSGKFEEIGARSGVAYSELGRTRSGMGRGCNRCEPGWLDGSVRR
jgi:enediyne biosynthesis protein E4